MHLLVLHVQFGALDPLLGVSTECDDLAETKGQPIRIVRFPIALVCVDPQQTIFLDASCGELEVQPQTRMVHCTERREVKRRIVWCIWGRSITNQQNGVLQTDRLLCLW